MAEEGEDEKDEEEEARMLMKVPDRGDIVTRGWALYERAFRRTPRAHVDEPISPEGTTERRRKKGENEEIEEAARMMRVPDQAETCTNCLQGATPLVKHSSNALPLRDRRLVEIGTRVLHVGGAWDPEALAGFPMIVAQIFHLFHLSLLALVVRGSVELGRVDPYGLSLHVHAEVIHRMTKRGELLGHVASPLGLPQDACVPHRCGRRFSKI